MTPPNYAPTADGSTYRAPLTSLTTETLRQYHFTDEQIDTILRVMRDKAFSSRFQVDCEKSHEDFSKYNELANQIEDQIVNHPDND